MERMGEREKESESEKVGGRESKSKSKREATVEESNESYLYRSILLSFIPLVPFPITHYSLTVFYTYLLYLPTHAIYKIIISRI